jgi:hypothetical protein
LYAQKQAKNGNLQKGESNLQTISNMLELESDILTIDVVMQTCRLEPTPCCNKFDISHSDCFADGV